MEPRGWVLSRVGCCRGVCGGGPLWLLLLLLTHHVRPPKRAHTHTQRIACGQYTHTHTHAMLRTLTVALLGVATMASPDLDAPVHTETARLNKWFAWKAQFNKVFATINQEEAAMKAFGEKYARDRPCSSKASTCLCSCGGAVRSARGVCVCVCVCSMWERRASCGSINAPAASLSLRLLTRASL